jgi:hypothetical protein
MTITILTLTNVKYNDIRETLSDLKCNILCLSHSISSPHEPMHYYDEKDLELDSEWHPHQFSDHLNYYNQWIIEKLIWCTQT